MKGAPAIAIAFAVLAAASGVVAPASCAAASYIDDRGSIWTLTSSGSALPDADPLHETFRITLGVDTDAYPLAGSFIDQVAIKVSDAVFARSLVDAPSSPAAWTLVDGGIDAKGCSGSGSGFVCADSTSVLNGGSGVALTTGNGPGVDLAWVFDVTVDNGALFIASGRASVKGRYLEPGGPQHLISGHASLAPEPESHALLLAGLALLGFTSIATRRRR